MVPPLGSLGDNQLKISLQDLLNAEHQGENVNLCSYIILSQVMCMAHRSMVDSWFIME